MNDHPMHEVLDRWKTAFDGHEADAMAGLFTSDALFQGFGPEVTAGREAVRAYYAAVPADRTADDVTVLHTYTIGAGVAGGFADVTFRGRAGWRTPVHLSLVLRQDQGQVDGADSGGGHGGGWRIQQYHVSRAGTEH